MKQGLEKLAGKKKTRRKFRRSGLGDEWMEGDLKDAERFKFLNCTHNMKQAIQSNVKKRDFEDKNTGIGKHFKH